MILKRVVEFAERHASGTPSGYQPRFVTKVVRLTRDGSLLEVRTPTYDRKGARQGWIRPEPQESPRRSVNVSARLIADNAEYVLGLVEEGRDATKVAQRHEAWAKLVSDAAQALNIPEVQAVKAWLERHGPNELIAAGGVQADDDLTFEVEGVFPTDLPSVRTYWANLKEHGATGQCLITGVVGPVTDRMPAPIKGIPGGQMSGTALISVNNAAGESYGLSAALNSPISPDAAEKLCNGLNILVNDGYKVRDAKGKERMKYRYGLRVGPLVYVGWCKEREERIWDSLDDPDPEHVQQLIEQATTGKLPPTVEDDDFYMLSLSANSARIIVRDHHETTLATVRSNLGKWFKRLQLVGMDGKPMKPVGVYRLAASLYRDASKEMPAHVPVDLINAALKGRPLPNYLLGLAVKRNLAMQGPFSQTPAKTKILATSRLALIKAALTLDPEDTSLTELNVEQPPAYHCGRMLAVLESIQRIAALPSKLNATLVDRNYGAACASPASIFGTLLKDATSAHLPKLRKNRPGAYVALDRRLQEIALAIGENFPNSLPLKDQGLFALGYYHQRARDYAEAMKNRDLKDLAEAELGHEGVTE